VAYNLLIYEPSKQRSKITSIWKGGEKMLTKLINFLKEEEGTEVVEWALILLLIIVLVIAAIGYVGGRTSVAWQSIADKMVPST
jgi:Flp pilus assembly pilin Flp